jgi:twitching motility protein PilT
MRARVTVATVSSALLLLLQRAFELKASDLHVKAGRRPLLRIDGILRQLEWPVLSERELEQIGDEVTASTPSRAAAFRASGELDCAFEPPGLPRFRVNGFRQRGRLAFAFRLIPARIPTFEELSLPPGVARLAEERHGLILVCGATGAGKTTTLASIVERINRTRDQHVITIEDPIEFLYREERCLINQREVGIDTESFGEALRRVLRQDPDTIVIGELRDEESANVALQAAESGHLVLSTLHTIDARETVVRMLEFFPHERHERVRSVLAGTLRGTISQRLLPRRDGGRVPAVEVMVANARIRSAIAENRLDELAAAIEEGHFYDMQSFSQSLIALVLAGQIEREVGVGAATNRHDFLIALAAAEKERSAQVAAGIDFGRVLSGRRPDA